MDDFFEILRLMNNKSKFVIGDIQGCYKEFKNLLKLIDPNKENKFFCVGDLVNRGPESEKVVDYVLETKLRVCLVTMIYI